MSLRIRQGFHSSFLLYIISNFFVEKVKSYCENLSAPINSLHFLYFVDVGMGTVEDASKVEYAVLLRRQQKVYLILLLKAQSVLSLPVRSK